MPKPTPAEQDRFVALLDGHKRILYKIAGSYCRNAADREDLIQEMVAQLWRSFDRYDERFRFSTWMYRVALNVAISFHRRESRHPRETVPAGEALLEIADPAAFASSADPELETLHALLQGLDELDRALILLYLDGHRHDTIAEILGLSESNVGTKIQRIKQRLRRDASRNA